MTSYAWKTWAQRGALVAAIAALPFLFAPTDLIRARGSVLAGLVGTYGTGQWQVYTSGLSNIQTANVDTTGQTAAIAASQQTFAVGSISIPGATSGTLTTQSEAGYSGNWNFQWLPNNSTDWPGDTTIQSVRNETYHVTAQDGTGSVTVTDSLSNQIVNAYLPNMGEALADDPQPTVVTDTSDPNLTITTTTITSHHTTTDSSTMSDVVTRTVTVQRAYTAAWFQNNFTSPDQILLTFAVEANDVTTAASFSSSSTTPGATGSTAVSDAFSLAQ